MRKAHDPHPDPIVQAIDAIVEGFAAYSDAVWNLPHHRRHLLSKCQQFVEIVGELSDREMDDFRAEIRALVDACPSRDAD